MIFELISNEKLPLNSLINTNSSFQKKGTSSLIEEKKYIYNIRIMISDLNNIQNGKQTYMINSLINTNSNFQKRGTPSLIEEKNIYIYYTNYNIRFNIQNGKQIYHY